jgi:hypothetical protein
VGGQVIIHQPPDVHYWAVLTFGEIKQEVHAQVYPAGEIDFCENLDIVHFGWLVACCTYASAQGS